ncbi:MAG: LptE family protein [Flammeovirgaceae bacterium]
MELKNKDWKVGFNASMFMLLGLFLFQACASGPKFLSFTGGRLPPDKYQRVTIQNFFNDSPGGPANLGIDFTERLKEYYQRNTPLSLVDATPHIELSGSITNYGVTPVAPSAGDIQQAQLQRLTITVKVDYVDYVDDAKSFNSNFSFFQDFNANQTLEEVETELIDIIFDQIVFDIFNKTYANW